MIGELLAIAGQCDGVRCDMAMLVLPEVFERTWGRRAEPFWPDGDRRACASSIPASASWPRSTGTWSGRCSSRASTTPTTSGCTTGCAAGPARPVREHLRAGLDYQDKLARFLENHDEPRAAATFAAGRARGGRDRHLPVAGTALLPPGTVRGPPEADLAHLGRAPDEPATIGAARLLRALLAVLRRAGRPRRRVAAARLGAPAWDGNWTWDGFIALRVARADGGGCWSWS